MALNPFNRETNKAGGESIVAGSSTIENIKVLQIAGNFDVTSYLPVRQWLESATEAQPANVVVNLSAVTFLDSTALSTLVQGKKRAMELHGDLRLCAVQQQVRIIFELTRLDRVFEIFLSEEDAVQSFLT